MAASAPTASRDRPWRNWGGNHCSPAPVESPANVDDVRYVVRSACKRGRVRFAGASGAWSPLVPTDGTIVCLDQLTKILGFDVSAAPPTVRVESGVRMGALVDFLAQHGLALRSPTVFRHLTVGGAIATGSHGTGRDSSDLSEDVLAMTVVGPEGDLFSLDARCGDRFRAAQIALGTFGAVVDITLRCTPTFNVLVEDRYLPRDVVLAHLGDLVQSYDYLELYWFPFDDRMFVKTLTRVDAAPDRRPLARRVRSVLEHVSTHMAVGTILPLVSRYRPSWTRGLMALAPACSSFVEGSRFEPVQVAFHYQTIYPRCITMSYGVPTDDAAIAWERLMELVESDGRQGRFGVNMVAHARFIGAAEAFLSQSHGRPTCDLEVVTACDTPHAPAFYEAFSDAMLEFEKARPHWGKHIVHADRIAARFPRMKDFLALRKTIDPTDRFLNSFLEEVFSHA